MNQNNRTTLSSDADAQTTPEEAVKSSAGSNKKAPAHSEAKRLKQMQQRLSEQESIEEKIEVCLDVMSQSLQGEGSPSFREFWQIKQFCLPLFKESISPKKRSVFWAQYVELSAEARRLREILDEQSTFAAEQIELAIQAIERDLLHQETGQEAWSELAFVQSVIALKNQASTYSRLQQSIYFVSLQGSRINSLRKEILMMEMRIRIKNQFLARLCTCGDQVFPKRRELIQELSELFKEDVERFIQEHFPLDRSLPLPLLREEIKSLQALAKELTLNTSTFTSIRLKLSECWDQLKQKDKLRREGLKENFDLVVQKIEPFKLLCQKESTTLEESERGLSEILQFMKTLELGRQEVSVLKAQLFEAKSPVVERANSAALIAKQQEEAKRLAYAEKVDALKLELKTFIEQADQWDFDQLSQKVEEDLKKIKQLKLSRIEKQEVDRLFKQLKQILHDKKMQQLLDLPEEKLHALERLQAALEAQEEHRVEVKKNIEGYRKLLGGSDLDFEKAMLYREMIEAEKAVLEEAESAIEEIEEKTELLQADEGG